MRRAIRDVGRVQIGFETPPGQLGWVYELIADYGLRIVNQRGRCFTLEFQEWDAANSFLRSLFGQDVGPKDYAVRDSRFPMRRRRAFLLSPATLDALVLLTLGTVGASGLLYWPEYILAIMATTIGLILLYVTLRSRRC